MEYALRVHEVGEDIREKVVKYVSDTQGSVFLVREYMAARPHYQAYIRCEVKLDALRKRFKNQFPEIKGNKFYSLAVVTKPTEYLRYLCKGSDKDSLPDVVHHCGLVQLDIPSEHKLYWEANECLKNKSRTKKLGLFEQLVEFSKTLDPNRDDVRFKLSEKYVYLCHEIDKPINLFYAKSVINLISSKVSPQECRYLIDQINSR